MSPHFIIRSTVTSIACVLVLLGIYSKFLAIQQGQWLTASGPLLFYILMFNLFVFRHPSKSDLVSGKHYFFALSGTCLPLLMQASPSSYIGLIALGWILQVAGMVLTHFAIGSLGRSFGVFAANREIKTTGLYRFVRHPLYAAEGLWFFSLVLMNLSPFNTLLFCVQMACQIKRINDEEALLLEDSVYQQYHQTVSYKIVPGVY